MSLRGNTAVTPVRTGPSPTCSGPDPRMMVVCPTRTPATSVIAFHRAVGYLPTVIPSSRARCRTSGGLGACADNPASMASMDTPTKNHFRGMRTEIISVLSSPSCHRRPRARERYTAHVPPMKDSLTWLYPPIEPYNTGKLQVLPIHEIYFEQSGNLSGKPVIFLHGGPGGGSDPKQRRFFHPEKYRIVNFDPRGCGKSTPYASLEANTTWDLVADIEKIREHLGIERWQVFGGSWGSTLALAYAETHPDRVTELVLRGIFLLRKQEIDWFYQRGASVLYPDAWEPYLSYIPEAERSDLLSAYYRRLTSDDPALRLAAAKIWSGWEGATSKLLPDAAFTGHYEEDEFALA